MSTPPVPGTHPFPTAEVVYAQLLRREELTIAYRHGRASACEVELADAITDTAYINNVLATVDLDYIVAELVEVVSRGTARAQVRYLAVLHGGAKALLAWHPGTFTFGEDAPGSMTALRWFATWAAEAIERHD